MNTNINNKKVTALNEINTAAEICSTSNCTKLNEYRR